LIGPTAAEASAQRPPGRGARLLADTVLMRVVLEAVPQVDQVRLEVEPRPLRPESTRRFVGPSDLVPIDETVLAARTRVIRRLPAEPFTAFADTHCESGPGGLARASDSAAARLLAAAPRRLCVLLGVPVAEPTAGVARGERPTPAGRDDTVWTRVHTISGAGHVVYEVTAVRRGHGGWRVAGVERVSAVWS
jgi:hypothetical protein